MRKNITAILAAALILCVSLSLPAEEEGKRPMHREKLRETLQLRHEMRKIEKEAIENDAELQAILEEIKALSRNLREKLDAKLAGNIEYQEMKEQNEQMKEQWQKRREQGEMGQKEGMSPEKRRKKSE